MEAGCRVTVISFKGKHGKAVQLPTVGNFEGVDYIYTSGNIYKPGGFLKRNWQKLKGKWRELRLIQKLKKEGSLEACLITTMDIDSLLLYWLWLKLINVHFVLDLVELNSAIVSRSGFWEKVNDKLFDRFAVKLADGVAAISEYLKDHTLRISPKKPVQKIPIICDFESINQHNPPPIHKEINHFFREPESPNGTSREIRFLYCGSPSYLQLIQFVIDSFEELVINGKSIFLHIVMGGSSTDIEKADQIIANSEYQQNIRVFPNIPREEVIAQYLEATALLIPLRPTLQDKARFPHKIGEYLASSKPVITTAFGEINHYDFLDEATALIADDYDAVLFAEKMQFVLDNPEQARAIGARGRAMGLKYFNYKDLGEKMKALLLSEKEVARSTEQRSEEIVQT